MSSRGPDTDLKRWGLGIAAKGKKKAKRRAVVAVARKLAVLLHRLWVSGDRYLLPAALGATHGRSGLSVVYGERIKLEGL